jgi:hypothetical protein
MLDIARFAQFTVNGEREKGGPRHRGGGEDQC